MKLCELSLIILTSSKIKKNYIYIYILYYTLNIVCKTLTTNMVSPNHTRVLSDFISLSINLYIYIYIHTLNTTCV